jgi:hypothetical protein
MEKFKFWKYLQNFFNSHPPLEERIWELDPGWDGWYWDFDKNPIDYLAPSSIAMIRVKPK